ncbi:M20 family metallopeptidase [Fictibacillus phosphorivorans]|uniref:M20 family metallopeptidase n=1 Tax=Fictibacillus phosphorivorans TaxID=1221500 RepID=UPI0020402C32|nr:M20 family metallopeptidase [Fictibacillus phosphorivorans]MCM3717667.1 M20 family metallopeptidase [Fictibacillus phosphorivorans]MCM3775567.1 M20 family metallopeptidase [Fictibacillus phosphorivorans]
MKTETKDYVSEIHAFIEQNREKFIGISDKIWDYAETRFEEYNSADLLAQVLEKEGFNVERGVGGIKTAFIATYGSGKPVISLLGEFDALSGLSQKAGVSTYDPVVENGNGHGCGHNLLGTAPLAAAVAVKNYMEKHNVKGTIKYYGCPGEEGGSGKTYMVREGLFDDVDCALTWHPGSFSGIFSLSTLANYQVYFKFKGKASHAANSPHLGRSALDAVELMNVGVNYLREHIIPEARVHYSIVNTGGFSPNVVQAEAEVLYLIRAPKMTDLKNIYERVVNIAKGAALMTETEMEIKFDKACSNYIPNHELGKVLHENLERFGLPNYEESEMKFAEDIHQKITRDDIENTKNEIAKTSGEEFTTELQSPFYPEIVPYQKTNDVMFGSSDVGDVSWVVPTAQFWGSSFVFGTPLHSWQLVAQGSTPIGQKGMLQAGKALAGSAIELLQNKELLERAKQEFQEKRKGTPYECPIPPGVHPSPLKS